MTIGKLENKMKIDLMDQQPKNAKYPLYDEAQTEMIGRLVADYNGYLTVEDEKVGEDILKNGGTFEQFDETDFDEKFHVSY
jgi:hypothetical protein